MNVTDALKKDAEDRIKVGKEKSGTSAFNQVYDKFQTNQDKAQTLVPWIATMVTSTKSYLPWCYGDMEYSMLRRTAQIREWGGRTGTVTETGMGT